MARRFGLLNPKSLAAKAGDRYYALLDENAGVINRRVHHNLLQRHILKVIPELA
jgi:hypothetical protein